MYASPAIAPSWPYGLPSRPLAISYSHIPMTSPMRTSPLNAVAPRSIMAQRSSRPGPPSPCKVSLRDPKKKSAASPAMTRNPKTPTPGAPPSQNAPRMRTPRNRLNPGIHHLLRHHSLCTRAVSMKDLIHRSTEEPRECDGQGKRRGVALLLDRVDRLARDAHRLRKLLLGEAM